MFSKIETYFGFPNDSDGARPLQGHLAAELSCQVLFSTMQRRAAPLVDMYCPVRRMWRSLDGRRVHEGHMKDMWRGR